MSSRGEELAEVVELRPETVEELSSDLIDSWVLDLRAARKSKETIRSYRTSIEQYRDWCRERGLPFVLEKEQVKFWVVRRLDEGNEASTVRARLRGVRVFSKWCADEGETETDDLLGMASVKVDEKPVDPLTDDQLQALFKVCEGKDFAARRDEAFARLLAESGLRASEILGMTVSGTSVAKGQAVIMGKGGKGRVVPFGPVTARALDRYLRMRRTHRLAGRDTLWLGVANRGFGYSAAETAMKRRAQAAGIEGFHMHRMRNTSVVRYLRKGGSELGAMAIYGWSSLKMLDHYSKAARAELAIEEHQRLNLGEL